LNAILNKDKQIVHALAGGPRDVMEQGVPLSREVCQVSLQNEYDLMIAAPGGYPKDINLYQSQKAMFHASQGVRTGGRLIIAAACSEGIGSLHYENWMSGMHSYPEIITRFVNQGFQIGPHKAFLIARDASRVNIHFFSQLDMEIANKLLLNPVENLQVAVDEAISKLDSSHRVGILSHASSTIPYIEESN
jgi:nickel-dependent lactate racemase